MDNTVELMFQLIDFEIFSQDPSKINLPKEPDEETLIKLYRLSRNHDLCHIIADALNKLGLLNKNFDVSKAFKKQQLTAGFRYEKQKFDYDLVKNIFNENEIQFVPLKGAVIREYYPEPWLRTSCDIDILIHESELDKAISVLEKNNFTVEGDRNYHDISLFSQSGTHLELHFSLLENNDNLDKVLSKVWDNVSPKNNDTFENSMTNEYFIFHQYSHAAYHFIEGGCGIRPFIDIALLEKNIDYSHEKLTELLKNANILTFVNQFRKLSDAWFNNGAKDEFICKMEDFILNGGIYGNAENKAASGQIRRGGRLGYIAYKLWQPYDVIKNKYPILNKYKFLLPFYEARRMLNFLTSKDKSFQMAQTNFVSDEKKAEVNSLLTELEII